MMNIRRLHHDEHPSTRVLYEEVFAEDSRSFVDYYYEEKTKDNVIYAAEDEGILAAMLHLNPYDMMVNNEEVPSHYIVAVATKAQYRRRGIMAALLKQALREMYLEREPFTFLMPAAEQIYYPHDFRTVYEQKQRMYCPGEENPEEIVSEAKECDAGDLALSAEECLSGRYQVYAKRDERYYRRLMREYKAEDGCLMLYRKAGDITDCRPFMNMSVSEEAVPKIMIRIIDLRRMLMLLRLNSLTNLCFQVADPIIEENNCCLVLTGTEFSGVMLTEGEKKNSEGTIPVAVLGELIFGKINVCEAVNMDGVEMSDRMQEEWSKIVPLSKIYLNETV